MKHLILACLLLASCAAQAQSTSGKGSVSGTVQDAATGKPVDYATVSLFRDTATQPVNGGITDGQGAFSVVGLAAGSYRIWVDFINYHRDTIDHVVIGNSPVSLGIIRLQPAGRLLQGVTVTGAAPLVENKIDKIVFNAANDVTSQGGVALDVLKKVPQVTVDIDGNVELQGNANIRFLINGKPSSVFGNSLTDALSSIPASQIRSIEAITSPGSRYDAQGTGGIINIILKDNKVKGYNGNISLSAGTRIENGAVNLNLRQGSFGLNAFLSGNAQLTSHTPFTQDRQSADTAAHTSSQILQDGSTDFERRGYQTGLGFDWSPSKKDNFSGGVSFNYYSNSSRGVISQQTVTRDAGGTPLSDLSLVRTSDYRWHTHSPEWNLGYKHNFGREGQELELLYSASYGIPYLAYTQSQVVYGQSAPFTGSSGTNPGTDRQTELSADYTHPLSEKVVLQTGVKTILQQINTDAAVSTLNAGSNEFTEDPGQSYHLQYRMNIYAGYASLSFPLFHFLDIKGGGRYEYTSVNIDYPNTSVPSYGLLVPSVIVSHSFTGNRTLKISYTRRIERAEYDELNPFINRSDPNNLVTGNPLLKPEIGDNLELGYSRTFAKGGSLNISLVERINSQDHKRIVTYYPSFQAGDSLYTNVSVQTNRNTGTEYNSGVNISGTLPVGKMFSLRANGMLFHRYSSSPIAGNVSMGFRLRLNLNAAVQLRKDLTAEAFGNYGSAARNIQGRNPQSLTYTIALRKQLWEKKGSIGLTAVNPFNRYVPQVTTIATGNYTSYTERLVPYRSFGISFAYRFGRLEFKRGKEEESNYLNEAPAMGN